MEFEEVKNVIELSLGDISLQCDILYVGSTSIKDLFAKLILDIDIIINNKSLISDVELRLEKIGCLSRAEQGIRSRFAYKKKSKSTLYTSSNRNWQTHHLYVCYADSLALKNHLLFRNALNNNKEQVHQYSKLKAVICSNENISSEIVLCQNLFRNFGSC